MTIGRRRWLGTSRWIPLSRLFIFSHVKQTERSFTEELA